MTLDEVAAYIGAGTGIISAVIAIIAIVKANGANKLSGQANMIAVESNRLNVDTFKRQGVIELHMAWRAVNEINPNKLIGPDVNLAANALDLTSSLWNHDVMEKEILYQSYWASFRILYDTLKGCDKVVPGYTKKAYEFISPAVEVAYEDLKKYHLAKTKTSKLT